MAKYLSWAAIFLGTLIVLVLQLGFAEPSMLAGVLAPLLAVAGLLLAKRGGKRAPRVASVALAIACGAFAWPLLLFAPLFLFCRDLC